MKLKSFLLYLVTLGLVSAAPLAIGDDLPEMKGVNQDGKEVAVEPAEGNDWLVIYTYPKALTGG